jgi:undecaprenyl-diphosphatase
MEKFKNKKLINLLILSSALIFLGIFVKLTFELREDNNVYFLDREILLAMAKIRNPILDQLMTTITSLGSVPVFSIFSLIIITSLIFFKNFYQIVYLVFGNCSAAVISYVSKLFFVRPRPTLIPRLVEVSGFSYPSGHALSATIFYFTLAVIISFKLKNKNLKIFIFFFSALIISLISFSRVYLGVHFPSDVVSGASLGMSYFLFLTYSYLYFINKKNQEKNAVT